MPEFAKLIEVKREGGNVSLRVDGEEFPWYLAPGFDCHIERDGAPGLTVTILADEVQVADRLQSPPPPEVDWQLRNAETGVDIARYRTRQPVLVSDIVTTPSGRLWRIKVRDADNLVLEVEPYE